jgi:hypothetical protein
VRTGLVSDGGALYPTAGLKNTYGVSAPGTYEISPTASTTFCDADYSECFEIPLYANAVVANYDRYGSDPATGVVVRIYIPGHNSGEGDDVGLDVRGVA